MQCSNKIAELPFGGRQNLFVRILPKIGISATNSSRDPVQRSRSRRTLGKCTCCLSWRALSPNRMPTLDEGPHSRNLLKTRDARVVIRPSWRACGQKVDRDGFGSTTMVVDSNRSVATFNFGDNHDTVSTQSITAVFDRPLPKHATSGGWTRANSWRILPY